MMPEDELIQLRADNQALREQLDQQSQQLAQRDELIAQLQQRLHALEERLAKDRVSPLLVFHEDIAALFQGFIG